MAYLLLVLPGCEKRLISTCEAKPLIKLTEFDGTERLLGFPVFLFSRDQLRAGTLEVTVLVEGHQSRGSVLRGRGESMLLRTTLI